MRWLHAAQQWHMLLSTEVMRADQDPCFPAVQVPEMITRKICSSGNSTNRKTS
jgi:hypothetical protein